MQWLFYFLTAFGVSLALTKILVWLADNNSNKIFRRLGGVAIISSFVICIFLNNELVLTRSIAGLIVGSVLLLFFGVWDDFKKLSWMSQLLFQVLLFGLLIFFGYHIYYISNPFGGLIKLGYFNYNFPFDIVINLGTIFILVWLVGMINVVNWSDGIDGLSSGIGILTMGALFLVSLRPEVNQPAIAILGLIIMGSLLGFWWFNFPPGRIIAGTSGSYFIGFSVASLSIMAGTKIATTLLVLALPVVDAAWVIWQRRKIGKSITAGDKLHLHYRLKNLGWSDSKILLVYQGFLLLIFFASLFLRSPSSIHHRKRQHQ